MPNPYDHTHWAFGVLLLSDELLSRGALCGSRSFRPGGKLVGPEEPFIFLLIGL